MHCKIVEKPMYVLQNMPLIGRRSNLERAAMLFGVVNILVDIHLLCSGSTWGADPGSNQADGMVIKYHSKPHTNQLTHNHGIILSPFYHYP